MEPEVQESTNQNKELMRVQAPAVATVPGPAHRDPHAEHRRNLLDRVNRKERYMIYTVLIVILVVIAGAMGWQGMQAREVVRTNIAHLTSQATSSKINGEFAAELQIFNAQLMVSSAMRDAAMFLGFVVVFMGCMVCVKGVESSYELKVAIDDTSSVLRSSSAGLVVITLGAFLVACAVFQKQRFEFPSVTGGSHSGVTSGPLALMYPMPPQQDPDAVKAYEAITSGSRQFLVPVQLPTPMTKVITAAVTPPETPIQTGNEAGTGGGTVSGGACCVARPPVASAYTPYGQSSYGLGYPSGQSAATQPVGIWNGSLEVPFARPDPNSAQAVISPPYSDSIFK